MLFEQRLLPSFHVFLVFLPPCLSLWHVHFSPIMFSRKDVVDRFDCIEDMHGTTETVIADSKICLKTHWQACRKNGKRKRMKPNFIKRFCFILILQGHESNSNKSRTRTISGLACPSIGSHKKTKEKLFFFYFSFLFLLQLSYYLSWLKKFAKTFHPAPYSAI